MDEISKKIKLSSTITIENISIVKDKIGLFYGKTGIAIYFYNLYKSTKNKDFLNIANKLIEQIYESRKTISSCDIENGLTGIALGLNYLLKRNFIHGDCSILFRDIDDRLFQEVSYNKHIRNNFELLTDITLYFIERIRDISICSDHFFLCKELIIDIINQISTLLYQESKINEPITFDIRWRLPKFLVLLSKVYEYEFYNYKISKLIDEITPSIISFLPILDANKLYLMYALKKVFKHYTNNELMQYSNLLQQNIDLAEIINYEFKDKSINFQHGLTGFSLILFKLNSIYYNDYKKMIISRILTSSYWQDIQTDNEDIEIDLAKGVCGIGLGLLAFKNEIYNEKKN